MPRDLQSPAGCDNLLSGMKVLVHYTTSNRQVHTEQPGVDEAFVFAAATVLLFGPGEIVLETAPGECLEREGEE